MYALYFVEYIVLNPVAFLLLMRNLSYHLSYASVPLY